MNEYTRVLKKLIPNTKIYIIIIAIYTVVLFYYNIYFGLIGLFILAVLVYYNIINIKNKKNEWTKYIENISSNLGLATKSAVLNLPLPLIICEEDGTIAWYNQLMGSITLDKELLRKNIIHFIEDIDLKKIISGKIKEILNIKIGDKIYSVLINPININESKNEKKYIIMFYFIDKTEYYKLKKVYDETRPVVCLAEIDNFNEAIKNIDDNNKPLLVAEIDRRINSWANDLNAAIRKYDDNKYILFFDEKNLINQQGKKFDILDNIREINVGNRMPVTLSVGIGKSDEKISQLALYASSSKELALGRGGDQAVIKNGSKYMFYGGKTREVEKSTKVKARVIAHALYQLIEQSGEIFIMGHDSPDLDSLGSALGLFRAIKNIGKNSYIVINKPNIFIQPVLKKLEGMAEYSNIFITNEQAVNKIDKSTLIIVVDVHIKNLTEYPELLDKTDRIVVIDHHRKSADFIDNAILFYNETYASSTSELVTEILQYITEKAELKPVEAEALMAGIMVDTKDFTFKTGVRTFEAASFLRKYGADTMQVKQLLADDIDTYLARAEVIKNSRIIGDSIAIARYLGEGSNVSLIVPQAADELLNIKGINASFVLAVYGEDIIVSARSLGDINVQVILEKIGGGGHLTVAGAKLNNITIENAESMLIKAIIQYQEEGVTK